MEGRPLNVFLDISGTLLAQSDPKKSVLALKEGLEKAGFSPTFYVYSTAFRATSEEFVNQSDMQDIIKFTFGGDFLDFADRVENKEAPFVMIDNEKLEGQMKVESILASRGEISESFEDKRVIHYKGGDFCDYIPQIAEAVGVKIKSPSSGRNFPQDKKAPQKAGGEDSKIIS